MHLSDRVDLVTHVQRRVVRGELFPFQRDGDFGEPVHLHHGLARPEIPVAGEGFTRQGLLFDIGSVNGEWQRHRQTPVPRARWWLAGAVIAAGLALSLHETVVTLGVSVWSWSLVQAVRTRAVGWKVTAMGLTVLALTSILLVGTLPQLELLRSYITVLKKPNFVYLEYWFAHPAGVLFGVVASGWALIAAITTQSRLLRERLLYVLIIIASTLPVFIWFINRYPSFNYSSFLLPIVLCVMILGAAILLYSIPNLLARLIVGSCLILGAVLSIQPATWLALYTQTDDVQFRPAYATILEHYQPGDAIFGQYPRWYYLQGLFLDTPYIDLLSHQRYDNLLFQNQLTHYPGAWVVWETKKRQHVQPGIIHYVDQQCVKYHGEGVDFTGVEVYYCK